MKKVVNSSNLKPSVVTVFQKGFILCLVTLLFAAQNITIAQSGIDSLKQKRKELSSKVNNPTEPLTQIQLRDVLSSKVPEYDGGTNLFQVVPILPIPRNRLLNFDQLMKITFQVPSTPNPNGETGFGDIDLFDLITFNKSWGRWAAGLTFVFPTASSEILGQGKWQIGPAIALMYTGTQDLIIGAVFQNQISFAGDPSREDVNTLIITPTATLTFAGGWFAGYSDFDWTIDWRNDTEVTIPLGLQGGKVINLGSTPVSISLEGCWVAVRTDDFPKWLIGFECVLIFPSLIK